MFSIILSGDWKRAAEILDMAPQLRSAIHWAVEREAHEARRRIIKGITNQAPGGKAFAPLSALTLILRRAKKFRGSKILLVTASMRNSVTVKNVGTGIVFVGVLRGSPRPGGQDNYNIARLHELGGRITMRVNAKMHRWLMWQLRKAGYGAFVRDKRSTREGDTSSKRAARGTGGGRAYRTIVIKIPARPFIQPVIEEMGADESGISQRLASRISQRMKLTLGS